MPLARTSLLAKADFLDRNPGARLGPRLSPRPSSAPSPMWHGSSGRNYSAVVKAPGAPIPADSVVLAVRRDAAGRTVLLAAATFEADAPASFAAFPRIAHLIGATELQIHHRAGSRSARAAAAWDLSRRAVLDHPALSSRPLAAGGRYDRSAIMAAALTLARARRSQTGEPWATCLAAALRGVWQLARAARSATAH